MLFFSQIVSLGTGQAILFAPNGLGLRFDNGLNTDNYEDALNDQVPGAIGQGFLHVQSRLRITRDGGHSILAVPDPSGTTRLGRVSASAGKPPSGTGVASGIGNQPGHGGPGGTPAPTGQAPTGASVPSGPKHQDFDQMSVSDTSTASSADFQTEVPASVYSPPASSSTNPGASTNAEFKPILAYLEWKRTEFQCGALSVKNVRKYFTNLKPNPYLGKKIEDVIHRAEQRGLLTITLKKGKEWVRLSPSGGALATTARSVSTPSGTLVPLIAKTAG